MLLSTEPVALIVTGFHRSGTSMMMQALKGAGLVIGDDLLPPGASNPDGHFEDRAIVRLHDAILHDQHGSWHSPPADTSRISEEHAAALGTTLEPYLAQPLPWGFKDPRTCLFLPLWQKQLAEYRQVFIYRNPLDCIRSLQTRQAQELIYHPEKNATALFFWENPVKALQLWIRYNQAILDAALSAPDNTLLVSYEALVAGFPIIECVNRQLGLSLNTSADTGVRPQGSNSKRSVKQPYGLPDDALQQAHELTMALDQIAIDNDGQHAGCAMRKTLLQSSQASCQAQPQPAQTRERLHRMNLWQDDCQQRNVTEPSIPPTPLTSQQTQTRFADPDDVFTHLHQLQEQGQQQQADNLVVEQANEFPDDCTLNIAAGKVWLNRNELCKAEQHFRQAHTSAPRNKVPPMQLGLVARRRGDNADACHWLQLAIERDPHHPGLHALLAQSHQRQGNVADALDVTVQGLIHAPDHHELSLLEAELLMADRQPESALQRVLHVLTLHPECPLASKLHYHALAAQPDASRDESLPWFYFAVYRSMQAQRDYCHHLERALMSLDTSTSSALRAQIHRELDRIHDAVQACEAAPHHSTRSFDGA